MRSVSAWIKMVPEHEATGVLKDMYDAAMTPHGTVDNVMKVHSLRPHTMHGHVTLYKSVLHHPDITLPLWLLEVIASYTSIKNKCDYSLTHHFMNARKLLEDDRYARMRFMLPCKRVGRRKYLPERNGPCFSMRQN